MEHLYIVDENDEVVEIKPRHEVSSNDRCRIVLLWVTNESGKILIARRAHSKKTFPGLWSYAVTGAVSHPETYGESIAREMEEELGIRNFVPEELFKMNRDFNEGKCIGQFFQVTIPDDYEIRPDPEEVAEIAWVGKDELRARIAEFPEEFVHRFGEEIEQFLESV